MYTINEISIGNDVLVANVTLTFANKETLIVNVPVKFPKDKETVIAAVEYREKLEVAKHDAAPTLTAIKQELDESVVGKVQVSVVR
jgi:hypothetical protein